MTPAIADLIKTLEGRKAFMPDWPLFYKSSAPDPDCQAAAAALREQEAELEGLRSNQDQHLRTMVEDGAKITRLTAEVEILRTALKPFAKLPPGGYGQNEKLIVLNAGAGPYHFVESDLARAKSTYRRTTLSHAGEGPVPSTLAAKNDTSPSASPRGEPAPALDELLAEREWLRELVAAQTCSDLCDKTYEQQGCPSGECAKIKGLASFDAMTKRIASAPPSPSRATEGEIEDLISLCSMRPAPMSKAGQAWEDGARQGWEWACSRSPAPQAVTEEEIARAISLAMDGPAPPPHEWSLRAARAVLALMKEKGK